MPPARSRQTIRGNRLLAGLRADDKAVLASAVSIEYPPQGHVLTTPIVPSTEVWCSDIGIIALSVTDNEGRAVQSGLVGPEG
jgi:hypothetical protein